MRERIILFFISFLLFACAFSQENKIPSDSSSFLVTRLNINSNRGDFGPFLFQKKLYFTTGRVHRYGLVYFNEDTTQELEDVFYAEQLDSVNFKHPHYFSEKVNTKFNDGPLCFNKAGDVLYITGNDLARMEHHIEPLDLFVSHKVHGHWEVPVALPFCTGNYSYCHPALMNDQKTLIFASNIPGGFGGMDLYMTTFENGTWSIPKNLGAGINSAANEVFPFVNSNNELYFSSNKTGNLDVYKADLKDASARANSMGWPVNSDKDDFGVWIDSTGSAGYFSSNRRGNDDIYYFKTRYQDFPNCSPQEKPRYCYTFFEESTIQSDDTLGMTYEWDLGDGVKERGVSVKHCFAKPGTYAVQLNIVDKGSGALFYNELSYDFTVEQAKILFIDSPDTLIVGNPVSFDSRKSEMPGYKIGDRYWFFGDGKFSSGLTAEHVYNQEGDYEIRLGVVATNDSTHRIEKFCVSKKILVRDSAWIKAHESSRTHVVWPPPHKVKQTYHVTDQENVDFRVHLGTSTENIPVDSKIFSDLGDVKKTKEKETYHYTSGKVKKLTDAVPYYRKAKERGFKNAAVVTFYKDSLMANQERSMCGEIKSTSMHDVLDKDNVLWSLNIFFDRNKWQFDKDYRGSLDSLCDKLKQNKKLELIILAIADSVGSDTYNYKLSKKRAQTVQDYLLKKGISQRRLDVISLGEKAPVTYNSAKNVLLSNRRVEILVVKTEK